MDAHHDTAIAEPMDVDSGIAAPRPVGRPRLTDPIMDELTCEGAPTTIGEYIHDLLAVVRDGG